MTGFALLNPSYTAIADLPYSHGKCLIALKVKCSSEPANNS